VQHRLIEAAASIVENDKSELCFQHTVFCQTGLPYRDPGDAFPPCYGHRDRLRIAKGRGREITRSLARPPPAYEAIATSPPPKPGEPAAYARIDGRSLRRSGRTLQLATRVSPESTPGCG
jgi:hypothetical protein